MYYRCIRTFPFCLIVSVFCVCFGLFAFAIYKHDWPSFDDPLVGFEVRDLSIAKRINTWKLLIESTSWNGLLSLYPKPYQENSNKEKNALSQKQFVSGSNQKTNKSHPKQLHRKTKLKQKEPETKKDVENPFQSKNHLIQSGSYFCGKIFEDYVHFVVETNDQSNLFDLKSIQNICKLDHHILRMEHFNDYYLSANISYQFSNISKSNFRNYCEVKNSSQCCPSWTISNFILLFVNKTDCYSLTEVDIDAFVGRLRLCSPYFADHYLTDECSKDPSQCPNVPESCYANDDLVYNVFNFLVDYRFFKINEQILIKNETNLPEDSISEVDVKPARPFLSSTSIFLPMAKSSKLMSYYEAIMASSLDEFHEKLYSKSELSFNNIYIVAADLGLKHTLFSESLVSDLVLTVFAACIILGSLLIFTRSIVLTITALLANLSSLGSAYFIYTCLFEIHFFPFLNLLSLIILIGIGSDNALIYCKAWSCVLSSKTHLSTLKNNRRHDYHTQMNETLSHVLMSSFCASLTTCGAFFAGYFSDITSLKCFSIFAGTSVITNFFITVITFPSALILSEKISTSYFSLSSLITKFQQNIIEKLDYLLTKLAQFIFGEIILKLVFNCRYYLVTSLTCLSIVSGFIVFYSPGLQLPSSQDFQIFSSNHIFERYDLKYKNEFWFSRFEKSTPQSSSNNFNQDGQISTQALIQSQFVLPIRVVFGVLPSDNGDYLNPFDRGKLEFDPNFDMSTHASQLWLLDFCRDLRTQPFYKPTIGPLLTNCFIETFKSWMEDRRCSEAVGNEIVDRYPCCELSKFPYEPQVFNQCLVEVIDRLHRTPNYMYHMNRAGPRFNSTANGIVKAIVIEYDSVYDAFSNSYNDMAQHWKQMDGWISEKLQNAPKELRNGWFITANMEFFALQQSLSTGVLKSLVISVLFAFITLICTTWNVRLSVLSTISISFVIFSTIASLVMLDWRLNIIESITISLTIGLAIDATLHYTIAYKLLTKGNRLLGIQMTIARIGSPVAMGAVTTFLAGAIMLFSYILAYIQIGTFLMLLSVFSWIYSTLFHLSLLSIFGAHHEDSFSILNFFAKVPNLCRAQIDSTDMPAISVISQSSGSVLTKNPSSQSNLSHSSATSHNNNSKDERRKSIAFNQNELLYQPNFCLHVTSI